MHAMATKDEVKDAFQTRDDLASPGTAPQQALDNDSQETPVEPILSLDLNNMSDSEPESEVAASVLGEDDGEDSEKDTPPDGGAPEIVNEEANESRPAKAKKEKKGRGKTLGNNERLARNLWRFRQECKHVGIFECKKISEENTWKWSYMIMKSKEVIESNERKKTQAVNAHANRKKVAIARAKKQEIKEQIRQARYVAGQTELHTDVKEVKQEKGSSRKPSSTTRSTPPKGTRTRVRAPRKAAHPEVNDDDEDGPPVIRGLRRRADKYLETLRKMEKKRLAEQKNATGDRVDMNTASEAALADIFEHQMSTEEVQRGISKRRAKMQAKAKRDAEDCLRNLLTNKSAKHCYKRLQKNVLAATKAFFKDFEPVEVG